MTTPARIAKPDLLQRIRAAQPPVAATLTALSEVGIADGQVAGGLPARADRAAAVIAGVRAFQQRAGLPATGQTDPATLTRLRAELTQTHVADSRFRTGKVQALLTDAGFAIDPGEVRARTFGASTTAALTAFQSSAGLADHGLAEPDTMTALRDRVVTARLASKTQIAKLQRTLLRAARISGLTVSIDGAEMKSRQSGPSTAAAITALQTHLGLPATGVVDSATLERISSIAASRVRPPSKLGTPDPAVVTTLPRQLRLNARGADVPALHRALAFLGHAPAEKEFKEARFGRSTRAAVLAFQGRQGLQRTGAVDAKTLKALNKTLTQAVPATAPSTRIRGSVRDTSWAGIAGAKVTLSTNPPVGAGTTLATRTTLANGFFDMPYVTPTDTSSGQPVSPLSVRIDFARADGTAIGSKTINDPTPIAWANFTEGPYPYAGPSVHAGQLAAVAKVGVGQVSALVETAAQHDVTRVAQAAGLTQDDLMRLILAVRAAAELGGDLDADVCFAFLAQSLPTSVPADLLAQTDDWALIDQLTDRVASGIAFTPQAVGDAALDAALAQNLVPVTVAARRDAIRTALAAARQRFALDRPMLVGNGTLRGLLQTTTVPAGAYPAVADAFVDQGGLGDNFWTTLRADPGSFGGDAAVRDLELSVDVGLVAKNHPPMVALLRQQIADPAHPDLASSRDMAKLSTDDWLAKVVAGNIPVPANTDGATDDDKRRTYAATMAAQSERLFPTVALTAQVGRGATDLDQLPAISALVDAHPALELRHVNIDAFVATNNVAIDAQTRGQLLVLQRVSRLAPDAATATALLEQQLHSSVQLVEMGKEETVRRLALAGVDQRTALTVHGYAEIQYAQVLHRLGEFRTELQAATPAALSPQVLTTAQRAELLGQVPDLDSLFGPVDMCDCPECASVYGPAAYLADLLRFLAAHQAQTGSRTVLDVLTARRPDLIATKLDCVNTETPLPYIDLVTEMLEAAVPGSAGARTLQTTWSADELRAAPEHVDLAAWEVLRTADIPLSGTFDLFQTQTRLFCTHLGVSRWELMRTFVTDEADPSAAADLAAEYFGISSHEASLITTAAPTAAAQDAFWGFDSTRTDIPVSEVLTHTQLGYQGLLLLLQTHWITPDGAPRVVLARPADVADLDQQTLQNMTPAVLDRIHRMTRLSRHVPWDSWELDLLLRAPRIGNGTLDAAAMVALRAAAQLSVRLQLSAEQLAGWFGPLPTEGHPSAVDAGDVTIAAPSAYARTWTNASVLDPPDPAFDPPAGGDLEDHRSAITAALSITDDEATQLLTRTGTTLDLETLSVLTAGVALARLTMRPIAELVMLIDLLTPLIADPFAGPDAMITFLDTVDELRATDLSTTEIDYLIDARPDSPFAPVDDVIAAALVSMRESLRTNPASGPAGQIAGYLSGVLRLTPSVTTLLLAGADTTGPLADAFADAGFISRDASGAYTHPVSPSAFPRLFQVYRRLTKMARLVQVSGVADDQWAWLQTRLTDLGALRPVDLPVDTAPPAPLITPFLQLLRWVRADAALTARAALLASGPASPANPTVRVGDLVDAAAAGQPLAQLRTLLSSLTGLDAATAAALDRDRTANYLDPAFLLRLDRCAAAAGRLGVPPATALDWTTRNAAAGVEAVIAGQARAAAKAKYDPAAWPAVLTPLQDSLREAKRDALVGYLLENSARTEPASVQLNGQSWVNPRRWSDSDDLLRYFLVDTQMSSCATTSRIKQAIGSVQMFVQRALLNLEQPDVLVTNEERADEASLDSWRQWTWLKNFRVWQANRKVFLYPENWITPELRDDKTPFFTAFESELLQADITAVNAEAALQHYLESVQEVSHLDVVGVYHEVEDDQPWDNLPPTVNVLHVVGRGRGESPTHFYRSFDLNDSTWSPWEKIDVDIVAEQVVPVVYNRTLHLFWLQISEKQTKTSRQPAIAPSAGTAPAPAPPLQLELRLAWTTRRTAGWQTRQTAKQVLVHPWQRPRSAYTVKPRYRAADNSLWLDVYISMSLEFNNTKFWDPYTGVHGFATSRRFDETARPWHSSSFVFDGQVVDLRLKPLAGQYHVLDSAGVASENLVPTTSYAFVRSQADPAGSVLKPLAGGGTVGPRQVLPAGMHLESGRMVNNSWTANNGKLTVLENGNSVQLLNGAHPPFAVAYSPHHDQFDTVAFDRSPFFYTDSARSYFVTTSAYDVTIDSTTTVRRQKYTFFPFDHAYLRLFLRELGRSGVEGLLNRKIQRFPEQFFPSNNFDFAAAYAPISPTTQADDSAQHDTVDFTRSGAMSIYNWEIFFHIPFMIATKLMANQRFAEAMDWFHRIFDPTNTESVSAPQRYWVTKPFFDQNGDAYRKQRIESILADIGANLDEVRAWKNDPFVPDLIARYRPVAYQKTVVMRYIDNLVAWGDQLFRGDTIESINEATLLYVLAGELLGRRPEHVPAVPRPPKSFAELTADGALDIFGNGQVEVQLENYTDRPTVVLTTPGGSALPVLNLAYFGLPANSDLLAYWDTVADRLFKIRHCMNLSGVVRQLPLFEPMIDPAVLVAATAAGVDLDSVLADTPGSGSPYRFATLQAKAVELTGTVQMLGERMLSILDRRDVEGLSRLQAANEAAVQNLMVDVRTAQLTEAQRAREALEAGRDAVQDRIDYYAALPWSNPYETAGYQQHGVALGKDQGAMILHAAAGAAHLVPSFTFGAAGFGGSPTVTASFGGGNVGSSLGSFASLFQTASAWINGGANMLDMQAVRQRVYEGNQFHAAQARRDLAQLEKQIIAAQVRESVAAAELAAQERIVDSVRAVSDYLHTKYTNLELFDWAIAQLSTVYFQAFQLAFDLAKKAEAAYRFELADRTSPAVIQFGYWDSLKKGLLAGDRLGNDLRRLESRYLEQNRRNLQATTHISLATLMPDKLLELKTNGSTSIELPEWMFAAEHPGLFNLRMKSVAVTVPCTTGPFVGVHATLDLTAAVVRTSDSVIGGFGDALNAPDARFAAAPAVVSGIVTSHGSLDRGALAGEGQVDDRYTAFEGAGLISRLSITLDQRDNNFDTSTVTDFVLTFDYEGQRGGPAFVDLSRAAVAAAAPSSGGRLLALDTAYAAAWFRFLHPGQGADQVMSLPVSIDDLPFRIRQVARTAAVAPVRADLVLLSAHPGQFDVRIAPPGQPLPASVPAGADPAIGGLHHAVVAWNPPVADLFGQWQVSIKRDTDAAWTSLPDDLIEHAWLLVRFSAQ